jgi:FkbM family methyltransferase
MESLVRRGDAVVDVGANVGSYSYELARLVGRGGQVHAIEPDPASVSRLRALQKHLPALTVHPLAASDRSGTAELNVPLFAGKRIGALASLSVPRERAAARYETVSIRVAPLDAILPRDGRPIAFVKVDVEGYELAVLRGASATLGRAMPALLIEIEQRHSQADIKTTFAHVRGLGYVGFALASERLRPLDEFDLARDQLAFLGDQFVPAMPVAYVHDFLFVRPGTDLGRLMRSDARPG